MTPIEQPLNIVDYLKQFDFHIHSFSHCVLRKRGETTRLNPQNWELDQKLEYIQQSIDAICDEAEKKGIKIIALTEHPQFNRYQVPHSEYRKCLEKTRKRSKNVKILSGLELNLKPATQKELEIDTDEIGYEKEDWREILSHTDVIMGSMHYEHFKEHPRIRSKRFHAKATGATIDELARIRRDMVRNGVKNQIYVLGHPFAALGELNEKDYRRIRTQAIVEGTSEEFYKQFAQYLQSQQAVRFPKKSLMRAIAEKLYAKEIYPEFNAACIQKRHSDIRYNEPAGRTLLETYIETGIKKGLVPFIIPSSDAHRPEEVGELRLDIVTKRVPNIQDARVPYHQIDLN
jgi:histidinol phosphatase-like PHP family hydrolase